MSAADEEGFGQNRVNTAAGGNNTGGARVGSGINDEATNDKFIVEALAKATTMEAMSKAHSMKAQIAMDERMQTVVDEEQIHRHALERRQQKLRQKRVELLMRREREALRSARDKRVRRQTIFENNLQEIEDEQVCRDMKRARKNKLRTETENNLRATHERNQEYSETSHKLHHEDRTAKLQEYYIHEAQMREADIEFANSAQRISSDYAVRMAKLEQAMVELRNEARLITAERELRLTELAQSIGAKYGAPLDEEYFE